MARRKPIHRVLSQGIHERFDAGDAALPRLVESTQRVEAAVGREFGFVVHIERARGLKLAWEIDHPGVPDSRNPAGPALDPFRGVEHVPTPTWDFYLGDALWAPLARMVGPWRMSVELEGRPLHRVEFVVNPPAEAVPEGPQ